MKTTDIGRLSIKELIEQIESDAISPGAGTAAAVVLAFAAACASKAISITLKNQEDAVLARAQSTLARVRREALIEGERDATLFEESVRNDAPESRHRLIGSGRHLTALERELIVVLDEIEGLVAQSVTGDVTAARQLCSAAMVVHRGNLEQSCEAQSNQLRSDGPE